jgi:glycosyltransferase involved in cell wall biosynthesis
MQGNTYSVVIPAYNASATIFASVASCLRQTLPPFEVIVVNDASTDNTATLLQEHFEDLIVLINLEKNSGPAAARNAGIAAARGTHITFQDADDIWHPEKLAIVDAVLKSNAGIDFLFHPFTLQPADVAVVPDMLLPERYPFWRLLLGNVIGTPCVVMKNRPGLRFNERLRYMEDYELFLREASDYGAYSIAAPLTQIGRPVLSAGGQSGNRWKMRVGEMRAWLSLAGYKPLFLIVLPFLMLFSLVKHLIKSVLR